MRLSMAFVVGSVLSPLASAQRVWHVDVLHCSGSGDGSAADPFCAIQEAVDVASSGDRIAISSGEYVESVLVDGLSLTLLAAGRSDEVILRSVPDGVDPSAPALHVTGGGGVVVDSLTLRDGRPAVLVETGSVGLRRCRFLGNRGLALGSFEEGSVVVARQADVLIEECEVVHAGEDTIAVHALDGDVVIRESSFHAQDPGCCLPIGGALYLERGTLIVERTSFSDMDSWAGYEPIEARDAQVRFDGSEVSNCGGDDTAAAIRLTRSTFVVRDSVFHDNEVFQGSGTLTLFDSVGGVLDCLFRDNDLFQAWTGGILSFGSQSDVDVSNCFFERNAGDEGGAVACWAGSMSLDGCSFVANAARLDAGNGAGGALYVEPTASVTASRCVFYGNRAPDAEGGAVFGPATLLSCTVVANESGAAGGGCHGAVALEDSIVWGNLPDQLSAVGSVRYSDVQGGWPGTGNIDADPRFWSLAAGDLHLRAVSPCIDAGDPTRQDGDGTRIDMGALPYDPDFCGSPNPYCSAKISAAGCSPAMGWSGTPGLAGPDDFHVLASDVRPNTTGLFFWSPVGPAEHPFFGGFLCVGHSIVRSPLLRSSSGGGACGGIFDHPFTQAEMANRGLQAGSLVYFQLWYRDPAHSDDTGIGLSNGLEVMICAGTTQG